MDPLTQGAVGAVAAQLGSKPARFLQAAIIGALGGMAPDLDILIRSSNDPLLALQFHRQITHSLLMIPLLGGLVGLIIYWLLGRRWQISMGQAVLWSILGYATHGLLDGCTSYGTQLLWPFSEKRFAWDLVSVVDPLFTLPVVVTIAFALRSRSKAWLVAGVSWMFLYLAVGYIQHDRAIEMGRTLAVQRGHQPLRLEAKPSFGNLVVWKIVYESNDHFFVDAVKPGWGQAVSWSGAAVKKMNSNQAFPWLDVTDQQHQDIERFAKFSADYIAVDPGNALRVFDVRYSMLPHQIKPMWGIELSKEKLPTDHVDYFAERANGSSALGTLWSMIFR